MLITGIKSYIMIGLLAILAIVCSVFFVISSNRALTIEQLQSENRTLEGNNQSLIVQTENLGLSLSQSQTEAEAARVANEQLVNSIKTIQQFLDTNRLNLRTLRNSPQADAALSVINRQVACLLGNVEDINTCADIQLPSSQSAP